MTSVLIVLSSARVWTRTDGTQHPTGFWAEEFTTPHRMLVDAGVDITVATPGGLVPVPDQKSLDTDEIRSYLDGLSAVLSEPARLEDVDPADYDAVLIPGGHGPMQDLAVNPDIARVLAAMLPDPDKAVAALCHGLAAFLPAGAPDGSWLFRGRRMTSFNDEEERMAQLAEHAPWLLETRLRQAGADFETAPAWSSHVVVDGNLITGQNPGSAEAVGEALLTAIR
jgi:putative intracellular protease/amidase